MNSKRMMVTLLTAVMVWGASEPAFAAEKGQAARPAPSLSGMGDMPMGHGMMGSDGMMGGGGMMGMMQSCQRMMGGTMTGSAMLPRLPPGNEKLEFQMRAEMMQKLGEIAAKYGEKIKDDK